LLKIWLNSPTYTLNKKKKKTSNFEKTTSLEIKKIVAIHSLFYVLKYPRTRMYWENKYKVYIITNNMTRNRFYALRMHFHVIDNLTIPENNNDFLLKSVLCMTHF
jgi:hypothetical protein